MLTNDEIDRQVALIEGWTQVVLDDSYEPSAWRLRSDLYPGPAWKSPQGDLRMLPPFYSTHWSWCGPLVESYFISLYRGVDPRVSNGDIDGWVANAGGLWFDTDGVAPWVAWDENPKRAACLSLIKFRG